MRTKSSRAGSAPQRAVARQVGLGQVVGLPITDPLTFRAVERIAAMLPAYLERL